MHPLVALLVTVLVVAATPVLGYECSPTNRTSGTLTACIQEAQGQGDNVVRLTGTPWEISSQVIVPAGMALLGPAIDGGVELSITWTGGGAPSWDVSIDNQEVAYRNAAVMLNSRSALEGLTFSYPAPGTSQPSRAWPTVGLLGESGSVTDVRVERNFFRDSYYAVSGVPTNNIPAARLVIRQNEFSQHALAVRLDDCAERCVIEKNNFGARDGGRSWGAWILGNANAIELRDVEGAWVESNRVRGYRRGINLRRGVSRAGDSTPWPSNVHVRDLTCQGCNVGVATTDFTVGDLLAGLTVEASHFEGKAGGVSQMTYGIYLKYARDVVVSGCAFTSSNSSAVWVSTSTNLSVAGNVFADWNQAVQSGHAAVWLTQATNAVATGNVGSSSVSCPSFGGCIGVHVDGATRVTTSANSFAFSQSSGFRFSVVFDGATNSKCFSTGDLGPSGVYIKTGHDVTKWPAS